MCGDRGRKLKKLIFDENLNVRKVSFASDEGRELVYQAVTKGIGSMPFFTDGKKYTYHLEDFIVKEKEPEEKEVVVKKAIKKNKKGGKNAVVR